MVALYRLDSQKNAQAADKVKSTPSPSIHVLQTHTHSTH